MIDKFSRGFINSVYEFNDFTINELLCKLAQKMDEVITQSNESFNYLDWLKGQGLSDEIVNTLLEWKENGTLNTIINQNIFNSLNDKIDNFKNDLDNEINDINIQMNNIISQTDKEVVFRSINGDDTENLQLLLDTGKNLISYPNEIYKITHPLYIKNSNQFINFNNSTIEFTHDQTTPHTNGNYRTNDVGIFNIRNYEEKLTKNITEVNLINGKLTLIDTNNLNVNDYILIDIYSGEYSSSKLNPKVNVLTKIINITENVIEVDYSCEWELNNFTTGYIKKVKPQENITLKNVTIEDNTPLRNHHISSGNKPYPTDDSHYTCCGIAIVCSSNIVIDNITHKNGLFNTIHSTNSYNCRFKNITTVKPRLWGPGEGYSIQNIGFNKVNIENVTGFETRHTLDFSGGGYAICKNIKSYRSKTSDLQFHGSYEHDILIDNFTGVGIDDNYPYFNAGSGESFGNSIGKVNIINSKLKIIATKNITYIKEIKYNNCNIIAHRLTNNVIFDNCYVQLKECSNKDYLKRTNESSKLSFYNSVIELMTINETLSNYNQFEINGGKIINNLPQTENIVLGLTACNIINIINVSKIDCAVKIINDSTVYGDMLINTNICNNNFYGYKYGGVWLLDINPCRHLTVISNNNFRKSPSTTETVPYSISLDGVYKNTSNVNLIVQGNNALNTNNNVNLMNNNANSKCSVVGNIGIEELIKG